MKKIVLVFIIFLSTALTHAAGYQLLCDTFYNLTARSQCKTALSVGTFYSDSVQFCFKITGETNISDCLVVMSNKKIKNHGKEICLDDYEYSDERVNCISKYLYTPRKVVPFNRCLTLYEDWAKNHSSDLQEKESSSSANSSQPTADFSDVKNILRYSLLEVGSNTLYDFYQDVHDQTDSDLPYGVLNELIQELDKKKVFCEDAKLMNYNQVLQTVVNTIKLRQGEN